MSRGNGRTEPEQLDVEHELPAAEETSEESKGPVHPEGEIGKLRAEHAALVDRLARLQAEFENARKRAVREQQEYRDFALSDAVKTLLPVVDSFDLALRTSAEKSEFRNGVELINKQLHDALEKLGLKQIPAKGEPFDPRFHEAIEMVDTNEVEDQYVIDELQRGYKLKERLVRPAMVRVARNSK
ncbi:MAG TPA: nucleotide exchange factor GrpE [Terriglobales bacterium]|nr:nucleotide exchange factor GrpE [Terriglobales bacterium]